MNEIILGGGGAGSENGRWICCNRRSHSIICKNFRPWWIIRSWLTKRKMRNV